MKRETRRARRLGGFDPVTVNDRACFLLVSESVSNRRRGTLALIARHRDVATTQICDSPVTVAYIEGSQLRHYSKAGFAMAKGKQEKTPTKTIPKSRAFASADAALRISAQDFCAWQGGLDLSSAAAARLLYVAPNTLASYRADGGPPSIARQCWAIVAGIQPDTGQKRAELLGRLNAALDG